MRSILYLIGQRGVNQDLILISLPMKLRRERLYSKIYGRIWMFQGRWSFTHILFPGHLMERQHKYISVRFNDALYSLLTNKILMKEEHLSFPNAEDPCSGNHYSEITPTSTISQLHHGSWRSESWEDAITRVYRSSHF